MAVQRSAPKRPARSSPEEERSTHRVTLRAVVVGLVFNVLLNMWLHKSELLLGTIRGYSGFSHTSVPLGAFDMLFALVIINLVLTRLSPSFKFSPTEMLTVYVMTAVSTMMSSSGCMHFLVPTITAVHWFANSQNEWAQLFQRVIPEWLVQTDPIALRNFYNGNAPLELFRWVKQIAVWGGFMLIFTTATLCLSLILRKQWIEREHLPFPTVVLPMEVGREGSPLLKNKAFWGGMLVAFGITWINNLAVNFPAVPFINVRPYDYISTHLPYPPWNAIGWTPIAFFPFAIGMGYLIPSDVAFSVWFFWVFSKFQQILGAMTGWSQGPVGGAMSAYPYLPQQCAGAFLGLALASIWVSRLHFKHVFKAAISSAKDADAKGYRIAAFGFLACTAALIAFTMLAGASILAASLFIILLLMYLMATTRMRAESGSAWPADPGIDPFRLMVIFGGSSSFRIPDLTAITYVRSAVASDDFRGVTMPLQLDGLKIADSAGMSIRSIARTMVLAVGFGFVTSMIISLVIWNHYGALAKVEAWRSMRGLTSFNMVTSMLKTSKQPDTGAMLGTGFGTAFTLFLAYMRTRFVWWPFHPVGYCLSNTATAYRTCMPFFIAWAIKTLVLRAGGIKLYRQTLPFFLGLIAGDFIGGGLGNLVACFTNLNTSPNNF